MSINAGVVTPPGSSDRSQRLAALVLLGGLVTAIAAVVKPGVMYGEGAYPVVSIAASFVATGVAVLLTMLVALRLRRRRNPR